MKKKNNIIKIGTILLFIVLIISAIPFTFAVGDEASIPTDTKTFARDVYYAILNFFEGTLYPVFIFIMAIFIVMIMLLIGFLIKKIMQRIAELGSR